MLSLLNCPKCKGGEISAQGEKNVRCTGCGAEYSFVQGLLAFFADEKSARVQWQNKLSQFLSSTEFKIAAADRTLRTADLAESTRNRAAQYKEFLEQHLQQIKDLLQPFVLHSSQDQLGFARLLSQRVPSRQHVLSYFQNIFRDWAWDSEQKNGEASRAQIQSENQITLELVGSAWPKIDGAPPPLVVLGSGPGRLASDLQQKFALKKVICLDINPLQLTISKRMTSQQPLDLTEINETPLKASQIARTWKLQASNQTPENHILHIWADGINLPFKKNLDITILTPWFIDIIPEDFAVFARRLNTRLKTGTFWINFGPLGFGAPEKSNSYTADEIRDCLTHAGFEIEFWQEQEIPYLQSPLSPQHRTETVLIWRAKKTKGAKEPSDHTYYPEWMTDLNQPIPTLDEFRDLAVKSQFEAQILSAIDGKISIRSFTQAISQQSGISVEDAENLLLTYFSRWHEGN